MTVWVSMTTLPVPTSAAALYVVIRYVRPLFRHLLRAMEDRLAGTGLSVPMRGMIERLYEAGPQTVPQIARALMVQRQVVQRLIDEALALALVERGANPAHKRSPTFRLTEAGRQAIEAVLAAEGEILARLATGFDADDVEAATRVMQRLTEDFAALAAGTDEKGGPRREPPG